MEISPLFEKVISLFSSSSEGERVAAFHKATALLKKENKTWDDFFKDQSSKNEKEESFSQDYLVKRLMQENFALSHSLDKERFKSADLKKSLSSMRDLLEKTRYELDQIKEAARRLSQNTNSDKRPSSYQSVSLKSQKRAKKTSVRKKVEKGSGEVSYYRGDKLPKTVEGIPRLVKVYQVGNSVCLEFDVLRYFENGNVRHYQSLFALTSHLIYNIQSSCEKKQKIKLSVKYSSELKIYYVDGLKEIK